MALLGIRYALTGPDGTRIVVGNCDEARQDPDFVGYLDDDGITGLDSPEVRQATENIAQGDGATNGPFFYGPRPITIPGWIPPDGLTPEQLVAREEKIQRATNAMRADAVLVWTPPGRIEQRLFLRRQQVRITGRLPKKFVIGLVSADHRIFSTETVEASLAANGAVVDPFTSMSSLTAYGWDEGANPA